MEKLTKLDALIIGGGPAGATAGLLLAEAGWSVGIVEKKKFPRRKVCGEFISATSLPLLQKLGIAELYLASSGPEIRRVAVFIRDTILESPMPSGDNPEAKWGRAFGREHLDTALINKSVCNGATLWQPASVSRLQKNVDSFQCTITVNNTIETVLSSVVIIANGSWERSIVETNDKPHQNSDLLAFKAHFKGCELAPELMPLIAFPGGYGGLVNSDNGRVTLSCCIRRDTLHVARKNCPGKSAGEAVLEYIKSTCYGVRMVLAHAEQMGSWLAAGPIRPGIRKRFANDLFFVGNMAGEAHPIVAEGISMAMQSSWLLADALIKHGKSGITHKSLAEVGSVYSRQWQNQFANRIHAATLFAFVAMHPWSQKIILPILKRYPSILTFGAKLSGKIKQVIPVNKDII
jgi:menaquinone-9 beta-reductase